MKNYKELKVWNVGVEIVKEVYDLVDSFPSVEKYGLRSQITRAAVSIPINIAEGAGRSGKRDFRRFLEIGLGSCLEVETLLYLVKETKLCSVSAELEDTVEKEIRMLKNLIHKVNEEIP